MAPDPGEPGADVDDRERRAAGVVPGSPLGGYVVHLLTWLTPLASAGDGRWSTACPADVAGLPSSDQPREVHLMAQRIDCPGCLTIDPARVAAVNAESAAAAHRRHAAGVPVLAFLRWAREQRDVVIADYAGGVTLKPYPSHFDERFVREWLDSLEPE